MHSPLDSFPSERSGDTARPKPNVPPTTPRGEGRPSTLLRPSGPIVRAARGAAAMGRLATLSVHAISARAIGAEREGRWSDRVTAAGRATVAQVRPAAAAAASAAAVTLAACRRGAARCSTGLRRHAIAAPAWVHDDRTSIVATAAVTSACVSLLTMWLWGPGGPSGTEPLAATSHPRAVGEPGASFSVPRGVATQPGAGASISGAATSEPRPGTPQTRQGMTTPAQPAAATAQARRITAADSAPAASPHSARAANPPTPAAGSNASTRLVIVTEPEGARVTINGVGWGTTPLTIRYLSPGAKRIRLTRSGYRSEERAVNVAPGRMSAPLRIRLREAPEARAVR
jgi:hypothetical protein